MIDAIYALLSADAILATLLTGGVVHQRTAPEVSRQYTPSSFDGDRNVMPTLLVALGDTTSTISRGSAYSIQLFYYEKWNYVNIEQARKRVKCLLHNQFIADSDGCLNRLEVVYQSGYTEDQALDCRLLIDRVAFYGGLCEVC